MEHSAREPLLKFTPPGREKPKSLEDYAGISNSKERPALFSSDASLAPLAGQASSGATWSFTSIKASFAGIRSGPSAGSGQALMELVYAGLFPTAARPPGAHCRCRRAGSGREYRCHPRSPHCAPAMGSTTSISLRSMIEIIGATDGVGLPYAVVAYLVGKIGGRRLRPA